MCKSLILFLCESRGFLLRLISCLLCSLHASLLPFSHNYSHSCKEKDSDGSLSYGTLLIVTEGLFPCLLSHDRLLSWFLRPLLTFSILIGVYAIRDLQRQWIWFLNILTHGLIQEKQADHGEEGYKREATHREDILPSDAQPAESVSLEWFVRAWRVICLVEYDDIESFLLVLDLEKADTLCIESQEDIVLIELSYSGSVLSIRFIVQENLVISMDLFHLGLVRIMDFAHENVPRVILWFRWDHVSINPAQNNCLDYIRVLLVFALFRYTILNCIVKGI